jgi:hypothetical protein
MNTHWMFPNRLQIRKPAQTTGKKTKRNERELKSILRRAVFCPAPGDLPALRRVSMG